MTQTHVEGDEALRASLSRVAGELDDLNKAGTAAGQLVKQTASGLAPVDTGALSRSITATATGETVTVGTPIPYAPFQEYGTSTVPASPFMGPAIETNQERILDLYREEVDALIHTVKGA